MDRKYIVPTHVITTASMANSWRMVGMAIFTAADRNGVIKAVAVDMISTIGLLTAILELPVISINTPLQMEDIP
jgi:hypothetical protein